MIQVSYEVGRLLRPVIILETPRLAVRIKSCKFSILQFVDMSYVEMRCLTWIKRFHSVPMLAAVDLIFMWGNFRKIFLPPTAGRLSGKKWNSLDPRHQVTTLNSQLTAWLIFSSVFSLSGNQIDWECASCSCLINWRGEPGKLLAEISLAVTSSTK